MSQQFEPFAKGFKTTFEVNQKMAESARRSGEVALDSMNQWAKDQFEFGHSCLDINRKQMAALQSADDVTAAMREAKGPTAYFEAAQSYGEALRKNVENTFERMAAIGHETTDAMNEAGTTLSEAATAQAKEATSKKAAK